MRFVRDMSYETHFNVLATSILAPEYSKASQGLDSYVVSHGNMGAGYNGGGVGVQDYGQRQSKLIHLLHRRYGLKKLP